MTWLTGLTEQELALYFGALPLGIGFAAIMLYGWFEQWRERRRRR